MKIKLRDYQKESITKIYNSWNSGHRAPLLVLPTGAGKTITFTYINKKLVEAGKTCWVLVHRHNLAVQTSDTFKKLGIEHAVIGAGFSECLFYKSQVAKVGSIISRVKRLPKPNYIIVDEAHHATAGTWKKILELFPNARVLGVTATPERLDGKMLGVNSGGFFDDLIIGPTMKQLVIEGYLMSPKYFNPCSIDDSSFKTKTNGEFDEKEAAKMLDKPKILSNVVGWYRKICNNKSAIAFCCNVKHAEDVAEEFNNAGYRAVSLVGKMDFRHQQSILEKLSNGEIDVVTSCEIISEGTDIPDVSAAILLRPTWSLTLYLQQVGRALRVAKDGRPKFIIDMVGNYYRHGHPLMDRDWQIEGQKKTKKQRKEEIDNFKIKTCSNCFGSFELADIKDNICPNCGEPFTSKQRKITIVDGELQEIVWDELELEMKKYHQEQNEADEKRRKKREYWASIYSCKSKDELIELAKEKGYKNPHGWAHITWQRVESKLKK